jgi:hypothetical protein
MKVSRETLWRIFTDLIRALAVAGIAYGLIDLASRALVS